MAQDTIGAGYEPPPPPPEKPAHSAGDYVRTTLRGIGQTLITLGLVVLLFVVYEVYVTSWFTHREQTKLKHELATEYANGTDPLAQLPNGTYPNLKVGQGIGNILIPRLGRDFDWAIVEGSGESQLDKGPGHYAGTALPGEVGNFAVAGHRVGKGEPFLNLDHLKSGDTVIIETEKTWFVYVVKGSPSNISAVDADGIPGREIVGALNGKPLYPVPDHPGVAPTEKLITLTTCHPKFSASHRMIVYGVLKATYAQTPDFSMPTDVKAYYNGVS